MEKSRGKKSRATVPLKKVSKLDGELAHATISLAVASLHTGKLQFCRCIFCP
jgi:hypothetical protein